MRACFRARFRSLFFSSPLKALLFRVSFITDGTLTNSEPIWHKAIIVYVQRNLRPIESPVGTLSSSASLLSMRQAKLLADSEHRVGIFSGKGFHACHHICLDMGLNPKIPFITFYHAVIDTFIELCKGDLRPRDGADSLLRTVAKLCPSAFYLCSASPMNVIEGLCVVAPLFGILSVPFLLQLS